MCGTVAEEEIQPVNETTRRKLTKEGLLDLRCGGVGKTKVWIGRDYPGQGLPYSKEANPFESCDGLSQDEKMSRFEVYLQRSKLMDRLGELEGKTLLCRCSNDGRCHGDVQIENLASRATPPRDTGCGLQNIDPGEETRVPSISYQLGSCGMICLTITIDEALGG